MEKAKKIIAGADIEPGKLVFIGDDDKVYPVQVPDGNENLKAISNGDGTATVYRNCDDETDEQAFEIFESKV